MDGPVGRTVVTMTCYDLAATCSKRADMSSGIYKLSQISRTNAVASQCLIRLQSIGNLRMKRRSKESRPSVDLSMELDPNSAGAPRDLRTGHVLR
jgi:hypothetical protein